MDVARRPWVMPGGSRMYVDTRSGGSPFRHRGSIKTSTIDVVLGLLDTTASSDSVPYVPPPVQHERSTVISRFLSPSHNCFLGIFLIDGTSSIVFAAYPSYDQPQPSAASRTPKGTVTVFTCGDTCECAPSVSRIGSRRSTRIAPTGLHSWRMCGLSDTDNERRTA
jgi:hypothetical protein